jgi:hypothetical protein
VYLIPNNSLLNGTEVIIYRYIDTSMLIGALLPLFSANASNITRWSMEENYNASTLALRIVKGDEKGTRCLGI